MGVFAVLAFKPFLLTLTVFLLVIVISRYVSLGSLLAALSFPVFTFIFNIEKEIILLGFILFLIIAVKHYENIKRLIKRKERKLGNKAK